jgi:DNA-binding NarL/FixJ family response regulator
VTIRILLADDQSLLRLGYRMALETQPDLVVVGEAGDGRRAVSMTASLRPDVVLMDVRMPILDGIAATRDITASTAATRVLVLTLFNLDEYVFAALRAGASGFLLKSAPPAELFAGIRAVAAGDGILSPAATRHLVDAFAGPVAEPAGPDPAAALEHLTPRERDVLLDVAAGSTNTEIATRYGIATGTVKLHVGRILAKLHLRDRVQIVIFAYEHGLVAPGRRRPPGRGTPG